MQVGKSQVVGVGAVLRCLPPASYMGCRRRPRLKVMKTMKGYGIDTAQPEAANSDAKDTIDWVIRPSLKKSLFPIQQVAEIVASWAAAILFFSFFFFFVRKC